MGNGGIWLSDHRACHGGIPRTRGRMSQHHRQRRRNLRLLRRQTRSTTRSLPPTRCISSIQVSKNPGRRASPRFHGLPPREAPQPQAAQTLDDGPSPKNRRPARYRMHHTRPRPPASPGPRSRCASAPRQSRTNAAAKTVRSSPWRCAASQARSLNLRNQ